MMWPLFPGSLTEQDLLRFKPLNFSVLSEAYERGLINQGLLMTAFRDPDFAVSAPSELLKVFLRTSSYIDRDRDIKEELTRLRRNDVERRPTLWMILARLIVDRYDPSVALQVLQQLAQDVGMPGDMVPFLRYGAEPSIVPPKSDAAIVAELRDFLTRRGA